MYIVKRGSVQYLDGNGSIEEEENIENHGLQFYFDKKLFKKLPLLRSPSSTNIHIVIIINMIIFKVIYYSF